MQYKIERVKRSDFDEIEIRSEMRSELEEIKNEVIYQDMYLKRMPFFTVRGKDNKIAFIYGYAYGGTGTYFPIIFASKYIDKYKRLVIKLFYDYFAVYVPVNCRRLEAYCDLEDPKSHKIAKHFGFVPIGIRHRATPEGHDQVIMERLVSDDIRKVSKNESKFLGLFT